jgi:Uma2 family endonuclease
MEEEVSVSAEPVTGHTGEWHAWDLDDLPEGTRYEVFEGNLIISPRPRWLHQKVAAHIWMALEQTAPEAWSASLDVEIRFGTDGKNSLCPDVVVATSALDETDPAFVLPEQVRLAVEVVSPNSRSMDRLVKPAVYAKAGIPTYWLVEPGPGDPSLTEYVRDGADYRLVRRVIGVFRTDDPWPVTIDLSAFATKGVDGEESAPGE